MLRLFSIAALVIAAALVTAAARPEAPLIPDPDLYVTAGCAGCHGSTAAGAIGPTLAGTGLTFDAFLEQLRSPRAMMPPITPSLVSDAQARSLFDYVTALEEPDGGPIEGTGCLCGQHGRGHHRAGAGHGPHHRGAASGQGQGQGQGRGRGGACRHGVCGQGQATG